MDDLALIRRILTMMATQDMRQLNSWEEMTCPYCSGENTYWEEPNPYPIDETRHKDDCLILQVRAVYARIQAGETLLLVLEGQDDASTL